MKWVTLSVLCFALGCAGGSGDDDALSLPDDARQIALTYEAIEGLWDLDTDASDALPFSSERLWIGPQREDLPYVWLLTNTTDAGGTVEYRQKLSLCGDHLAGFNATCTERPFQVLVTPDTLYVLDNIALRVYRRL